MFSFPQASLQRPSGVSGQIGRAEPNRVETGLQREAENASSLALGWYIRRIARGPMKKVWTATMRNAQVKGKENVAWNVLIIYFCRKHPDVRRGPIKCEV